MTTSTLPDAATIQSNPGIVFGDVDGEVVALNHESGSYIYLNTSGSFIFNLLEGSEPRTVEWLRSQVAKEYEVDAETCHREVGEFVARCVGMGLLRVASGSAEMKK